MADSLSTIGSISIHIANMFNNLTPGVSGNLVQLVDLSRQEVANYTGNTIGSNSIIDKYQPAITNLSIANTIDMINAQAGGGANLKLAELSIGDSNDIMSADQYRKMAQLQLGNIGRWVSFARSVS